MGTHSGKGVITLIIGIMLVVVESLLEYVIFRDLTIDRLAMIIAIAINCFVFLLMTLLLLSAIRSIKKQEKAKKRKSIENTLEKVLEEFNSVAKEIQNEHSEFLDTLNEKIMCSSAIPIQDGTESDAVEKTQMDELSESGQYEDRKIPVEYYGTSVEGFPKLKISEKKDGKFFINQNSNTLEIIGLEQEKSNQRQGMFWMREYGKFFSLKDSEEYYTIDKNDFYKFNKIAIACTAEKGETDDVYVVKKKGEIIFSKEDS